MSVIPVLLALNATILSNKSGTYLAPIDERSAKWCIFGFLGTVVLSVGVLFAVDSMWKLEKTVVSVEVVQAIVHKPAKSSKKVKFKIKHVGSTYAWWSSDEIDHQNCPTVYTDKPKNVWYQTYTHPWFDSYSVTSGMITFCTT